MAELRCERLAKSYRERIVLREVDLVVAQGTLTAVLGASGSGKTTLLRVIMGLIEADAGRVLVGGSIVADGRRANVAPNKRGIGYVAQEGALFPHLTVAENVGFGLSRPERKRGARARAMLELVGLGGDYCERRPHELSGGEQRRVALARALAPRPALVLLDEPFSGLDAALRVETREAVGHALREEGATAVLVTHDQAEALSMGSEVAVLRDGLLVQHSTPAALYRTPVDFDVARFVGEANLLPGEARCGRVRCALGELDIQGAQLEGPVAAMLRPEQVRLVEPGREQDGECVAARVVDHAYYGPDTVIRLSLERFPEQVIKVRTLEQRIPAVGELVGLVACGPAAVYATGASGERNGEVPKGSREQPQAVGG